MPICSVCSQDNPDVARFCLACGAALSRDAPREERKIVTVLFADLVGFTSRAEKLDPEDVRAVLRPYWERLRAELERHGGTVEKFIGDAVMALFGAPVSHEDDPERAVRAALAIRDWVREEEGIQVRVAVATGEALVLLGAQPAEGEGMAAGDVVNTAARLQSAAPVNGVLVGETTYRATRDVIEYADHDPVVAKGKAEPIAVWEAVQALSRLGMDLEQHAVLPLVGRTREVETLVGAFERARRDREPQLVTLVGVPGIGKSRLVAELFARLDASPDIIWWRQGRALPYGEGVSFWGLGEMVKAQAGIQENDPLADAEAKLRVSVESVVEQDDRAWVLEHLLPLVGLEPVQVAGDRRKESFAAWRRYFEALADQRPLVLVFEDLHWADDGLLDFVDHLADWATGVPLLVVGTARPELLDRRPGWGGGKLNTATVALTPLADEDAARIIGAVLEQALLSADTQQALLERAGGNPLYAEQFARLYVERGSTDGTELPETIQGIIAARLDGLAGDEKRLLQDAAVVGKVFWAGAAVELSGLDAAAVEGVLHSLERKGLVRRERRSAVGGEEEYAFRHVLVRDVGYGQIPRAARAEKHGLAAGWIEALGRADDHAELVAHHYESALELARAAGSADDALVQRARVAFRRAGDRALRLNAFAAACRFYDAALGLWPDDGERPYLQLDLGRARFRSEGVDTDLVAAGSALERAGDLEAGAEAAVLVAHAAWRAGRTGDAETELRRVRGLLAGRPPSRAQAEALAEEARLLAFADRREEAERVAAAALELAETLGLEELRASVLNTLGVVRLADGDIVEARALATRAVDVASSGSPEALRALTNLAVIAICDGDPAAWRAAHTLAVDAATRAGDRVITMWLESGEIRAGDYVEGRWDSVLDRTTAFLDEVTALGGHYTERGVYVLRALIRASRGDAAGAERDLEQAVGRLGTNTDAQSQIPTLVDAAGVCLLLGDEQRALDLLMRALPFARASKNRAPGIGADGACTIVRVGLAAEWTKHFAAAADTARVEAARLVFSGRTVEAAEVYRRIAGPEDEAAARLLAAEQLVEQGRRAEADVQLQLALAFYRAAGATRVVAQAEFLLASTA
jgi:class 3 adenylate cyclase/tetratricopeptide (TPR) repeat protein